MKVKDRMVRAPIFVDPCMTLQQVARAFRKANMAVLPVGTQKNLSGTISDRDLVIRAILNGDHHTKPVKNYVKKEVVFCHEGDDLEDAKKIMKKNELNRVVVKDSDENVSGLLFLIDTIE